MSTDGWNVDKMLGRLVLMYDAVREHGLEPFVDLVKNDPAKAIEELPHYIEKTLSIGDGFFRGGVAGGGPNPAVIAPLLSAVGVAYPALEPQLREKALRGCFKFLDTLNNLMAGMAVEKIHEPWLVRDIVMNTPRYNPGYEGYMNRLKRLTTWSEFQKEFFDDGKAICNSFFWLAFAVRPDRHVSSEISAQFEKEYPDLVDRTQDYLAGIIHLQGLEKEATDPAHKYAGTIEDRLTTYPAWESSLRRKIAEAKWLLLPEKLKRHLDCFRPK